MIGQIGGALIGGFYPIVQLNANNVRRKLRLMPRWQDLT